MARKRANVCLSGGAPGADLAWGAVARRCGHRVIHFSFAGHRTRARRGERIVLSAAQLRTADRHLRRVARILGRRFVADDSYRSKLLRRNWFQVRDSARLYAVASFDRRGQVAGGTGWTVALFLGRAREAYLFDQRRRRWLAWRGAASGWQPIARPPMPHGRWTGIGTRRLSEVGRQAIRAAMAR
ncbi:MAG: hypothetical protein KGJ66_03700 [Alphaproteobacteria bacterium]|nr:hypothetical protein [Alphaproteobacteria bacterium]